jgi:hypothetical protein
MASLESLPPDQRAVLELVLRRGRSYDQIAEMLGIDRAGVRERALAALDALGPSTGVPAQRRALITDYLLGALPGPVSEEVRNRLASSAGERAWARVVAAELQEISAAPLPEIPVESPQLAAGPAEPESRPVRRRRPAAPAPQTAEPAAQQPASRTGGALLLAGAALVVAGVVAAIIATSGGSSSKSHTAGSAPISAATPTSTSTTGNNVQPLRQINLKSPSGGKAVGIAEILRERGQIGVAIVAQGLAPNTKNPANAYAVWLYNSPSDAHILGFVNPPVGNDGKLRTAGGFPSNASHFHNLLITLETQSNPKTPGTIVLEGPLTGIP